MSLLLVVIFVVYRRKALETWLGYNLTLSALRWLWYERDAQTRGLMCWLQHDDLKERTSLWICYILSTPCDISWTEHPIDLRPPSKVLFIRWQPGETNRVLYLSRLNFGGLIKCKSTFFPNSEIEQIWTVQHFSKNCLLFKKMLCHILEAWGLILI